MTAQNFILLAFAALPENTIKGRTKLQKVVYFLSVFTGLDELGYKPHYYGPYSGEVAEAVAGLCSINFLDCKTDTHPHEPSGFEVTRYDYSLTPDGQQAAAIVKQREPELWNKISEGEKRLAALGDPDYMSLSFAAKVWLMLGEKGGKATQEELSGYATRFGWTMDTAQIGIASDILQKLGMVSTTPAEV